MKPRIGPSCCFGPAVNSLLSKKCLPRKEGFLIFRVVGLNFALVAHSLISFMWLSSGKLPESSSDFCCFCFLDTQVAHPLCTLISLSMFPPQLSSEIVATGWAGKGRIDSLFLWVKCLLKRESGPLKKVISPSKTKGFFFFSKTF